MQSREELRFCPQLIEDIKSREFKYKFSKIYAVLLDAFKLDPTKYISIEQLSTKTGLSTGSTKAAICEMYKFMHAISGDMILSKSECGYKIATQFEKKAMKLKKDLSRYPDLRRVVHLGDKDAE